MSRNSQLACIWAGPIGLLIFGVGFGIVAGLVPPQDPGASAEDIAASYRDNADRIRAGLILSMIGGAMTGPFIVAITMQMRRIEGPASPLAWTNLAMGTCGVMLFIVPIMVFQAAAYRPDRDPVVTQTLNDLGWLMIIGAYACALVEGLAIAWCCFEDLEEKVLPRWLGYFNVWIVLLFTGGSLIYFFKDGAFAYNGIIGFWLVFAAFFVWVAVMFVMVRRAILRAPHVDGAVGNTVTDRRDLGVS